MLNKLKDLVFGLNEYDKTRIDIRFEFIFEIISKIEIKNIEDFENLETSIFKIREELRVRTSNLNKTINNPKRSLKKREVLELLDILDKIKYEFLERAFKLIRTESSSRSSVQNEVSRQIERKEEIVETRVENEEQHHNTEEIVEERKEEEVQQISKADLKRKQLEELSSNKVEEKTQKEIQEKRDKVIEELEKGIPDKKEVEKVGVSESIQEDRVLILKEEDLEVSLINGKVPYFDLNFKDEVHYSIVKFLAGLVFEVFEAHGTNILVENSNVKIIPRFMDDNMFNMPNIEVNVDEIFDKIMESIHSKAQKFVNDKKEFENKVEEVKEEVVKEKKVVEKEEGYIKVDDEFKPTTQSLKSKEDSLDALLGEIEDKKENKKKRIETSDKTQKKQVIEVEKEDEEIELNKIKEAVKETKKEEKVVVEHKTKEEIIEEEHKFELYKDDNIVVYLNPKSSVLGEIFIQPKGNLSISQLDEGNISYVTIFSKIFSSILFEVLGAAGTNMIFDFNSNKVRIVPRYQKDNLNNLQWELKESNQDFLEQVKNKLLETMAKEIVPEVEKVETKEKLVEEKGNDDEKEKAEYVLNSLRRIP